MPRTKRVFISYAREDKPWLERVKVHLAPLIRTGELDAWDDTLIEPGVRWQTSIANALADCHAAILLVSADYLASEFIFSQELPILLRAEEARGLSIIPVIVRPCHIRPDSALGHLQCVNSPDTPAQLMEVGQQELLWTKVADAVESAMKRALQPDRLNFEHHIRIPHQKNAFFVGRREIIQQLHDQLSVRRSAGLSSLGGMGKTQVAIEYIHRFKNDYRDIFWVRCDTPAALTGSLSEIAERLDLPDHQQGRAVASVRNWLRNNDGWLMVFDAADNLENLREVWPEEVNGHILVTSRNPIMHAVGIASPLELTPMTEDEALAFFKVRASRELSDQKELAAASDLARELGYLPLALEQAVAYVVANVSRFDDYLKGYRRRRLAVLRPPIAGGYAESIATTWALNFREVEQAPHSADLLRFSAFLAPRDIPLELIERFASEMGNSLSAALRDVRDDPLLLDETLEPLTRYSLISRNLQKRTYSVHRIVQAVILDRMSDDIQRVWAERAVRIVQKAFPDSNAQDIRKGQALITHAQVCSDHIGNFHFIFPEAAQLLLDAGVFLRRKAQFSESGTMLHQVLAMRENSLGESHPLVAEALDSLARLERAQGRYVEAENTIRRALLIRQTNFGPRHIETAQTLNSLSAIVRDQRRLDEAESLAREALDIQQGALSPENPLIAKTLTTLGSLLIERRQIDEAAALFARAVSIEEVALGRDAQGLAPSLTMLADATRLQGELTRAREIAERALEIEERTKGIDHPDTAFSLRCLSRIYLDEGQTDKAEAILKRAADIRKLALGNSHPLTVQILNEHSLLSKKEAKAVQERTSQAAASTD
jgi:tetratricopeptide (TPR) repeat protein